MDIENKFTREELIIINNALNEICNGVEIPEFELRIGYSEDQVAQLLAKVGEILDSSEQREG